MKTIIAALAAVLLCAGFARAADKVVYVTFDSVRQLTAKDGSTLDGSVKFVFAGQKGSSAKGVQDSSRTSANGFGKDKQDACRWALLSAFLKFQKKAQSTGSKTVSDVRTYAGSVESTDGNKCACLAGGAVVRSTVKGRYLK